MGKSVLERSQFSGGNVRSDLTLGLTSELEHSARLSAYREFWNFYKGKHWSYSRDESEPMATANFSRMLVDKVNGWLFKRGFEVSIPDDPNTEGDADLESRNFISQALNETWRRNGDEAWGLECGQMGGVTGDVFLRPSWETNDPLEDPFVRVDILPSHYVFPEFGGPEGADRKKVIQCLVLWPQYEYEKKRFGRARSRLVINGELWEPHQRTPIFDENLGEPEPNPYGEIPIIHISNMQLAGEFYGVSDLADLVELQRMYNEKLTDVSDIIDYHASPVTILKGQSVAQLERGANQMWGIKKNADIFNLELKGDLSASHAFIERLQNLMHMISGVPKEALGDVQNAANTSAVAMAIRFMPLTDVRDMKMATYGLGLRLMNRLILRTLELKDPKFRKKWDALKKEQPDANLYRTQITFNSPMPRDEVIELQKSKERLLLGLSSRRHELRRDGKTEEEINAILKEADKEKKKQMDMEFSASSFVKPGSTEFGQPARDGREDNKPPSGDAQAEKQSATKQTKTQKVETE